MSNQAKQFQNPNVLRAGAFKTTTQAFQLPRKKVVFGESNQLGAQTSFNASTQFAFSGHSIDARSLDAEAEKRKLDEAYKSGFAAGVVREQARLPALIDEALAKSLVHERSIIRSEVHSEIFEASRKQGIDAGLAEASKKLEQQVEVLRTKNNEKLEALSKLLSTIEKNLQTYRVSLIEDAVELAYVCTTRMVGNSVITREGIKAIVKHNLEQFASEACDVYLHGSDLVLIRELIEDEATQDEELRFGSQIRFCEDSTLTHGGVVIRGKKQSLEARLDLQLALVKDALLQIHCGAARAK